jgi:23S rRNA (uracil1939-C5)-methyltransferase
MQLNITNLDSKGFGIAKDFKGNKYKVLGALPNETVTVRIVTKNKKNIFAVIDQVIIASPFRVVPRDSESYLNHSAWQILELDQENIFKEKIVKQEFNALINKFSVNDKLLISSFEVVSQKKSDSWNYRNKAELQFALDEDGEISYALYNQGESWKKSLLKTSSIFSSSINDAAHKILEFIKQSKLSVDDLRYLILRSGNSGVVALLCLKNEALKYCESFKSILDENIRGLIFVIPRADSYEVVCKIGHCEMQEAVLNKNFYFGVEHFFQINIPMFERGILDIKNFLDKLKLENSDLTLVDLFAGVGVIGILLSENFKRVVGVEISEGTKNFALKNAQNNSVKNYEFYESDIHEALNLIQEADVLIVDPPRGGLTKDCLNSIKTHLPQYIIYLSCNHETFVKNLSELSEVYEVKFLKGYNFFPHTPHIECLVILSRRW